LVQLDPVYPETVLRAVAARDYERGWLAAVLAGTAATAAAKKDPAYGALAPIHTGEVRFVLDHLASAGLLRAVPLYKMTVFTLAQGGVEELARLEMLPPAAQTFAELSARIHSPIERPVLRSVLAEWFENQQRWAGDDAPRWREALVEFTGRKFQVLDKQQPGRQLTAAFTNSRYGDSPGGRRALQLDCRRFLEHVFDARIP